MTFETTSVESSIPSNSVPGKPTCVPDVLATITFPPTLTRMIPNQNPCQPWMITFPSTVSSLIGKFRTEAGSPPPFETRLP
jgi:hypothetical protein